MSWHDHFAHLADTLDAGRHAEEGFTLSFQAEDTHFVRFNRGRVRQPGDVRQGSVSLRWLQGRRHASGSVPLTGDRALDGARVAEERDGLRRLVAALPEDPHLLINEDPRSTTRATPDALPDPVETVETVCAAADGLDLVGILAMGGLHRGFANHLGQRNWFGTHTALFDGSLVAGGDKAVKQSYGGPDFSLEGLVDRLGAGRAQLAALGRPERVIPPGRYRAFLAPAAVGGILELLAWDAFSCRAQHSGSSVLGRLIEGEESLDPRVLLVENTAGGLGPGFQDDGFLKPDTVPLILEGAHAGGLVSPRSAREYGLPQNGASAHENPSALDLAGGELPTEAALRALGTGVWVSNLWYLNYSDRNAARLTGMTRFATFWVEDGEIVAPLSVMRFDDSLFDLLGAALEEITREQELFPSASTYGVRSTDSLRVPGLLVGGLTFTL